ncbi:hypothetical protein BLNAU_5726 [Blattamonas nauphoetae]|uniref:CCHC-type domain-containing protein n=1 Tax=Blattamonas nauphoetae TaxID=2049346 RepID=A0ABQ9Y6M8_9EUKA|nr:hypothetical protein BLNAU_5726 [Blattamonas nauphoetae]
MTFQPINYVSFSDSVFYPWPDYKEAPDFSSLTSFNPSECFSEGLVPINTFSNCAESYPLKDAPKLEPEYPSLGTSPPLDLFCAMPPNDAQNLNSLQFPNCFGPIDQEMSFSANASHPYTPSPNPNNPSESYSPPPTSGRSSFKDSPSLTPNQSSSDSCSVSPSLPEDYTPSFEFPPITSFSPSTIFRPSGKGPAPLTVNHVFNSITDQPHTVIVLPVIQTTPNENDKIRCFRCGRRGHMFANCPSHNSNRNGPPEVRHDSCFKCGRAGHRSKDCPNEDKRICFFCHRTGHVVKDCPLKMGQ